MTTRVIRVDPLTPDLEIIAEAAAILRSGGLVAFPTETVYGLGAMATSPEAVARIFEAKGRPSTNPLIVHVSDPIEARRCVSEWPATAEILANRFWPGPLTMILPRSAIIPDLVTAGQNFVGVRVPRSNLALALIRETGQPIAAPSANRSTGISPTLAQHVLKDLDGRIDLILDGGPSSVGLESTVVHLGDANPRVLRPGAVTEEQIAQALGQTVTGGFEQRDLGEAALSPGQQTVHYSPRTPTFRIEVGQAVEILPGQAFAFLALGVGPESWPRFGHPPALQMQGDSPDQAATFFYEFLHRCDEARVDLIVILPPPEKPEWKAIRDRVWRASRPWDEGGSGPG